MRYPNLYLENIDWSKVDDKHIYTILGVTVIFVGAVMMYLLITNSK